MANTNKKIIDGQDINALNANRQIDTLHDQFGMHLWKQGTDIVSAATITIGLDANMFDVTGSTTISAINSNVLGSLILLRFTGDTIIVHDAVNLILPDGVNLNVSAGDSIIIHEFATGQWRVVSSTTQPVWVQGTDIASAATLTIPDDGNSFDVTGTTTIIDILSHAPGSLVLLKFNSKLTIQHNAVSFIMPQGRDLIIEANDVIVVHEYASSLWRVVSFVKGKKSKMQRHNLIINGDFAVAQRGTSFTGVDSDVYTADRWIKLTNGKLVDVVQQNNSRFETAKTLKIVNQSSTGFNKHGILTILENRDIDSFLMAPVLAVSLSFKIIKTVANLDIRAAVLSSNVTADSVNSNIIFSWNGGGLNPTLRAGWTFANTPSNFTANTATWQSVEINNITVPTDTKNLAVFIWNNEDGNVAGTAFSLKEVQLEITPQATSFETMSYEEQLARCQRYFRRVTARGITGVVRNTTSITLFDRYIVETRIAPTVTFLQFHANPFNVGINGSTLTTNLGSATLLNMSSALVSTQGGMHFITTGGSGLTPGSDVYVRDDIDLFDVDAEL